MKNKFTPGPWHINGVGQNDYRIGICSDNEDVAEVVCVDVCKESRKEKSNARLIAAAPDLLAACEQALRLPCFQTDFMTDDELHVADLLLTVIRKARA